MYLAGVDVMTAMQQAGHANITVNQSMRIVRTEGNRIHNRSALDAALKAKARGADTVKVWEPPLIV